MYHFLFLVKKESELMGYDIYDPKKKIKNFNIEPGIYLAFSDETIYDESIECDLINFLYKNKVLLVRKKSVLERKL
tara:strand:- start:1368 stop:1595 length:228 start_codon:yes stop_codon:yes gene_type:complete